MLRDLFEDDDGGWLQDPALLDRLANEKLQAEAETLRPEGWKWIAVGLDFPYGHTHGLRRLTGETVALTEEERAACEALRAEHDALEQEYADAVELPDEVDARLGEIETALAAFDERPVTYDPAEIARAGAFVSIDADGGLRIERGYVRREDEAPVEPVDGGAVAGTDPVAGDGPDAAGPQRGPRIIVSVIGGDAPSEPQGDAEDDDGIKPLSERLVIELTAHRTLALRDALANDPGMAFTAVLHALCLGAFYRMTFGTCLEISAKSASFSAQAPGLADSASAQAIEARHRNWAAQLPKHEDELWDALVGFDADRQAALLAHCASLSVNAVYEPWNRSSRRIDHADTLARAVNLDMAAAGWSATVENYLGRVPKARILEAVREAKGEPAVQLIDHLKKTDMAREAERLLAGTRWVPEPLRTPDVQPVETATPKATARVCRRSWPKATTTARPRRIPRNRSHSPKRPNKRSPAGRLSTVPAFFFSHPPQEPGASAPGSFHFKEAHMPEIIETTVYRLDELSDAAKEKARAWYREGGFDYDWFESVYDDFESIAEILGLRLKTRVVRLYGGGTRQKPCIWFSGFSSQGDGACFETFYSYRKGAPCRIREYAPQDAELHRIADALQVTQRRNFYQLNAEASHRGRYYHEHCMAISVERDSPTVSGHDGRCRGSRDRGAARPRTMALPAARTGI